MIEGVSAQKLRSSFSRDLQTSTWIPIKSSKSFAYRTTTPYHTVDSIAVFVLEWMPSSPPQFQQEKEGGHESNGSPCSEIPPPRLEAGPPPPSSEGTEQIQNPMLMLMAGEAAASAAARLGMPTTLSVLTGEGQTRSGEPAAASQSPQEIPTRPTEFVTGEQSRPGQLHVAKSSELLEQKKQKENDITSKVNIVTNSVDVCVKEDTDADKEQDDAKKHQARADKSFATESQIPLTSTSALSALASRTEHLQQQQQQRQGPVSAKIVQQSIMGAVAAVASARPKESLESEVEGGSESKKMAANNDHSDNDKKPRRKRKPQVKPGQSSGRWTVDEHRAFLEGLRECGREWKKVALRIPTRTSAQIRSHAQKYFSKLQRDHENLMNHPGDHSSSAGSGVAAAEIQQMQPSVQGNADRILANPHGAQREVENTLEALRERYRQLQQRLEQRQRLRSNNNNNRSQVVEDDSSGATNPTRKRALEEPGVADHRSAASSMDDQSSVSSAVSASAASLASARDLGNEELIALSVLGADLARGDASNDGFSPPAPGSRRSPESSDNSTSDSDKSQEQGNSTSNKRHKKEAS